MSEVLAAYMFVSRHKPRTANDALSSRQLFVYSIKQKRSTNDALSSRLTDNYFKRNPTTTDFVYYLLFLSLCLLLLSSRKDRRQRRQTFKQKPTTTDLLHFVYLRQTDYAFFNLTLFTSLIKTSSPTTTDFQAENIYSAFKRKPTTTDLLTTLHLTLLTDYAFFNLTLFTSLIKQKTSSPLIITWTFNKQRATSRPRSLLEKGFAGVTAQAALDRHKKKKS